MPHPPPPPAWARSRTTPQAVKFGGLTLKKMLILKNKSIPQ